MTEETKKALTEEEFESATGGDLPDTKKKWYCTRKFKRVSEFDCKYCLSRDTCKTFADENPDKVQSPFPTANSFFNK